MNYPLSTQSYPRQSFALSALHTLQYCPMILRLSYTLAQKTKARPTALHPLNANAFADWSAHYIHANGDAFVIAVCTRSLYTVVVPAAGIVTPVTLDARIYAYLKDYLVSDGFEFFYRRLVDRDDEETTLSKLLDAESAANLDDLGELVQYYLAEEGLSPEEAARKLNEIPLAALNHRSPRSVFKTMGF
ncbi:MAG: hypothetical protein L3K26_09610 [Candidatus Hydrogenedentes bacterium]|nr:hypothetical protein [Candidatus Hydrogenedentota bacterium]